MKLRPDESRFKSACHSRMNWIISNIEMYLRQFVVFFYRKSQNNSIDFKYPLIKRVNTPLTSTSRIISCTSSSEGLRPNDRTACPTLSFAILPSFFRSNSVKASRTSEKKGYCIFEKVNRLCHCGSNLHFFKYNYVKYIYKNENKYATDSQYRCRIYFIHYINYQRQIFHDLQNYN